jgi:hypothetical protein
MEVRKVTLVNYMMNEQVDGSSAGLEIACFTEP